MLDHALQYAGRGWRVFPCHTTVLGSCSCGKTCGKDAGKHPRIKAWQKHATTDSKQITAWWTRWPDANIGIATGGGLVVVDLDGAAEAATLKGVVERYGPLPAAATVRTGRGAHLYFLGDIGGSRKAGGILIRGDGGYVIAPPSLHASGQCYQWIRQERLSALPNWFSQWLQDASGKEKNTISALEGLGAKPDYLNKNKKVAAKAAAALKTLWTTDEETRLKSALSSISADCERDTWLHVGMALHGLDWQASDGTDRGFQLWNEWSQTAKTKYQGLFDLETRWRSFGKPGREHVTVGTIYHYAGRNGWQPPAPRAVNPESEVMHHSEHTALSAAVHGTDKTLPHSLSAAAAGGASLNGHALPPEMTTLSGSVSPLIELNENYSVIGDLGGKCMVMGWQPSKVDPAVHVPSFQSFKSFAERFSNRYVEAKKLKNGQWVDEPQQVGAAWLKWPSRVSYEGIDLVPGGPELLPNGYYNLWQGFAVEPRRGAWPLMRNHIAKVLANHDIASLEYIVKWAAWKLQHPGEPTEAALVFKGAKGAGKGTFARALRQLFGQHGLQIYNSKHLVGSFNGHFRNCCLLYADEAFWAGDKQGESALMGLITEPTIPIEQKGIDLVDWKNRIGIVMTTNAEWVVPARHDERRYAVFQVSDEHSRSEAYFKALRHELDNGGLEAMLHDLLNVKLGDWHPRRIPQTEALQQQKLRSLDPRYEWFEDLLQNGILPTGSQDHHIVPAFAVSEMARASVPRLRDISATALGRFLSDQGCEKVHGAKGNGWRFDRLIEHRLRWERRFGNWKWSYKGEQWIRK